MLLLTVNEDPGQTFGGTKICGLQAVMLLVRVIQCTIAVTVPVCPAAIAPAEAVTVAEVLSEEGVMLKPEETLQVAGARVMPILVSKTTFGQVLPESWSSSGGLM